MQPSKDPLHGVTLEALLNALVAKYGWAELAKRININCFKSDPSVKSSLKFLRRTPWARKEVEELYIDSLEDIADEREDMPTDGRGQTGRVRKNSSSLPPFPPCTEGGTARSQTSLFQPGSLFALRRIKWWPASSRP
ncbi:Uncharacterized conserved protein (DUF2132) [Raoultella terrigena]|uniref:Uncharacterized conserved protein (DUF2132) n=1 Tax=Raoultella terrigena TaxID=577 RepID=A0A4U9D0Y5_RAOTE|nr:Uncharacterized conserved protein (DUF2132) [Raoultella terrigena]